MNLIRKLKISEIVPVDFTEEELEIIKLFDDNLKDLTIFIQDGYPLRINYMKNGSWIMQQDIENVILLVRYQGFWEVLDYKFGMRYIDIQILMKSMIERTFNQKVVTPSAIGLNTAAMIEIAFNQKVSTPKKT